MQEEQERLKKLLRDTVTMLCRNGLQYQRRLRVEGVIGITVDDDSVFLVHINDTVGASYNSAPQDTEYSQNVKLEYGYTDSRAVRPEPMMQGFSQMSSGVTAMEHITSTVVTESSEIKADVMTDEDGWGGNYEQSYSGLVHPWMDAMSSISNFQPPPPVVQHYSKPRMPV